MTSAFRVDDQIYHVDAGDDPGRQTQSTPSLPNARALYLSYRWEKASDDTLVMDWYLADTKAQACSLISKPGAHHRNEEATMAIHTNGRQRPA